MSPLRLQETDGVVVARLSGEIDLSNSRDVAEELAGRSVDDRIEVNAL